MVCRCVQVLRYRPHVLMCLQPAWTKIRHSADVHEVMRNFVKHGFGLCRDGQGLLGWLDHSHFQDALLLLLWLNVDTGRYQRSVRATQIYQPSVRTVLIPEWHQISILPTNSVETTPCYPLRRWKWDPVQQGRCAGQMFWAIDINTSTKVDSCYQNICSKSGLFGFLKYITITTGLRHEIID